MPPTDNQQKSKLQQVVDILRENNYNDQQIQEVLEDISKLVFSRLNAEIMAAFSEEEINKIEAESGDNPNQEEWEQKVKDMFIQKTGKNPDDMAIEYYEIFADGFLKEHDKDMQAQQAPPQNPQ